MAMQAHLFPGCTWISDTTFYVIRPNFGEHLVPRWKGRRVRMRVEISWRNVMCCMGNRKGKRSERMQVGV